MIASFAGVLIMIGFSSNGNSGGGDVLNTEMEFIIAFILNAVSATLIGLVNVVIRSLKGLHFAVAAGFQAIVTFSVSLMVLIIYRLFFNQDFDYSTLTSFDVSLLILNGFLQCAM